MLVFLKLSKNSQNVFDSIKNETLLIWYVHWFGWSTSGVGISVLQDPLVMTKHFGTVKSTIPLLTL